MPTRTIVVDGTTWQLFPSGFITPNTHDEFGLLFITGTGAARQVRVTRYSPVGARSREQSLAELDDAAVRALFAMSQTGEMSPEAGYAR